MNDWIGCLGTTPRAITPNIDRLAARGVNFTNAHTAGVFCAPSRAAIFSGQFASTTGCYTTANYFYDHPEISQWIDLTLNDAQVKKRGYFDPAKIRDLRKRMESREFVTVKQVMSLVILELWHMIFIDKQQLW